MLPVTVTVFILGAVLISVSVSVKYYNVKPVDRSLFRLGYKGVCKCH